MSDENITINLVDSDSDYDDGGESLAPITQQKQTLRRSKRNARSKTRSALASTTDSDTDDSGPVLGAKKTQPNTRKRSSSKQAGPRSPRSPFITETSTNITDTSQEIEIESSDESDSDSGLKLNLFQRLRKKSRNDSSIADGDGLEWFEKTRKYDDIVANVTTTDNDDDSDSFCPSDKDTEQSTKIKARLEKGASASITHDRKSCTSNIQAESSYLKSLRDSVKKRKFPLSQIPTTESIPTGRTIKKMNAWKGHWPPLREFLQNTIDHLSLLDGKTGRRRACINLDAATTTTGSKLTFSCGGRKICTMHASQDELIIDQMYTYPIASRALDTGVPDITKESGNDHHNDDQAGGFGDGFKTAAVALIANSAKGKGRSDFKALKWYFYARKERTEVEWTFEGLTRERVATFAKCDVLQVRIRKKVDVNVDQWDVDDDNDSNGARDEEGQQYIMRQVIQVKGIGKSFTQEVIPRFVVFWDLNEPSLLSTIPLKQTSRTTRGGGDFIGPVSAQPPLFTPPLFGTTTSLKPRNGVYVRGIWVRPTKIKDTIMSFFGDRLEVTGRDRNEVYEEQLIDAVVFVFRRCSDLSHLRQLLEPLRGQQQDMECHNDDSDIDVEVASCTRVGKKVKSLRRPQSGGDGKNNHEASWLLASPRFLNQVIELEKDFILYDVFQIPKGAIFVSSKTTKSKDPFIQWAANYLRKNGTPLVPIEKGSNRYLFEEVHESELTDRCVKILLQGAKGKNSYKGNSIAREFFRKIISFMGLGRRVNVHFFPDVKVAFVHHLSIYIPEVKQLTRDILVKVLNICNSRIEGVNAESYSCLMQAIFEIIPATANSTLNTKSIDVTDATKVVTRAKEIQKEIKDFLHNPICGDCDVTAEESTKKKRNGASSSSTVEVQDLIMLDVDDDENDDVNDENKDNNDGKNDGGNKNPGDYALTRSDNKKLERQIERFSRIAREANPETSIIPQTDFEDDNAGNADSCIRPSSSLEKITVNESLGGGCLYCDQASAADITNEKWNSVKQRKILILRNILQEASNVVRRSIPSLHTLLGYIHAGYDGDNNSYEAFCDGQRIIVNLFAYMPKLIGDVASMNPPYPRNLVHDFVIMITHELAHFLEPRSGHGPAWRDTHMKMVIEVMNQLKT